LDLTSEIPIMGGSIFFERYPDNCQV